MSPPLRADFVGVPRLEDASTQDAPTAHRFAVRLSLPFTRLPLGEDPGNAPDMHGPPSTPGVPGTSPFGSFYTLISPLK